MKSRFPMTASDPVRIRRALISVSDKTGLIELASVLQREDVEILSTGGTAKILGDAGVDVVDVADHTGFPEMMDGRLKTLHPKVHGGLLAIRGNHEHEAAAKEHGILPIDLLAVNLYPFEATASRGADFSTCVENIDIGGPAMIRAGAKNHAAVTVIVDPEDYQAVISDLDELGGAISADLRRYLAAKAYARTAAYDAAISHWFADQLDLKAPQLRTFSGRLVQELRYGENPHQRAAFYRTQEQRPGVATAVQHQDKELSYNNLNDTDAAFELISEFDPETAAVAIIKHANPCGVATGESLLEAYRLALRCDPVSAFGGVIALNRTVDAETANAISEIFTEVVIAPAVHEDAKEIFSRSTNLRLLTAGALANPRTGGLMLRTLAGGLLVQSRDNAVVEQMDLKVVTERAPTSTEMADLKFAFRVAKHVKSNAIVYARDGATVGIGAGQMSRVDASRIAAQKSSDAARAAGLEEPLAKGSVVASDAFFPFADGLLEAAKAGATAVIQPGGSIRDAEVIAAANAQGLAMVFTGHRHFRH